MRHDIEWNQQNMIFVIKWRKQIKWEEDKYYTQNHIWQKMKCERVKLNKGWNVTKDDMLQSMKRYKRWIMT